MERYNKQIPANRGAAFPPTIRFNNGNERDTALTQTHVQDVWDFDHKLKEIEVFEPPALI